MAAMGRIEELNERIAEILLRPTSFTTSPLLVVWDAAKELRAHGYPVAASDLYARAITWYESQTSPDLIRTNRNYYALMLREVGRLDEARAIREANLERNPQGRFAHANLAFVLVGQGHRDEALRHFRLFEAQEPPGVMRALNQASFAAALGEKERAVQLLREGGLFWPNFHSHSLLMSLFDYPPFRKLTRLKG